MSEIELLMISDSGRFMACLLATIWLIALVGTVYEVRRWWRNRSTYKPCEHLFVSRYSSTSKYVCFNCGDIK